MCYIDEDAYIFLLDHIAYDGLANEWSEFLKEDQRSLTKKFLNSLNIDNRPKNLKDYEIFSMLEAKMIYYNFKMWLIDKEFEE